MTRTEMKINGSVYNSTVLAKRAEDFIDSLPDGPLKDGMKEQTVTETLRDQLDLEIRKANKRIEEEELSSKDELDEVRKTLNPFVKAYNDSCRVDRLYFFEEQAYGNAVELYAENQCVTGVALTLDKEAGEFGREPDEMVYIKPYDFIRNLNATEIGTITDGAWLWLDNAVRFFATDSETGESSGIDKPSLSSTFITLRNNWGWEGASKRELKRTLAQIWAWMLGDFAPSTEQVRTSDINYVITSGLNGKDVPNSPGLYETCSIVDYVAFMFRAAYTCKYNLDYKVKHREKDPEKKTPKTIGRNKAMAEPPADKSKDATPKVTGATKSTKGKKSTKKVDEDPAHGSASLEPKAPKAEPKK